MRVDIEFCRVNSRDKSNVQSLLLTVHEAFESQ